MPLLSRHSFQSVSDFLKVVLIWVPFAMVAVLAFVGNTWIYLLELPLDLKRVTTCQVFPCLSIKYRSSPQLMGKVIVSIANLIICFVFFYELKRSGKAHLVVGFKIISYHRDMMPSARLRYMSFNRACGPQSASPALTALRPARPGEAL
ncbi:hypothetical protein DdX_15809 [Ditylenchus destructor]|uniref:Uncharacterized protein n=1 Tax=Ditylenchus destructor TaxID=166010 RepID=A0AAD4QXE1_9BILA|nr:hypothetical protein DdX_15809 [Ditylenchus destructor]